MATKQARELAPGDIVAGRHIRDGAKRMTVARVYSTLGGVMVLVKWSNGQESLYRPSDVVKVHHADTIGGAR